MAVARKADASGFEAWLSSWRGYAVYLGLATAAVIVTWFARIRTRSDLLWDEAVRVDAGQHVVPALHAFDVPALWAWLNAQVFYAFGLPLLHATWLALGADPVTSAWAPTLVAYAVSGALTAVVALRLGASQTAALISAGFVYSIPALSSLSSGAFTEPFGACLYLLIVLTVLRLRAAPTAASASLCAVVLLAAFWVKWDYAVIGLLTVILLGVVIPSGAVALRQRRALLAAWGSAFLAEAVGIAIGFPAKLSGLESMIGQGATTPAPHDPLFYLKQVLLPGDLGIGYVLGPSLIASTAIAVVWSRRDRRFLAPLVPIFMVWTLYSFSSVQHPRYLVPILPLQCAILAAVSTRLNASQTWIRAHAVTAYVLSLAVIASVLPAWLRPTGDLAALASDRTADEVTSDLLAEIPNDGATILMLPTNEVSPSLVDLHEERAGHVAPTIIVPSPGSQARPMEFDRLLSESCPNLVIAVEAMPGSPLYTADYRQNWLPEWRQIRKAQPYLVEVREDTFDAGHTNLWVWRPSAACARRPSPDDLDGADR